MKAFLMHRDRDFAVDAMPPPQAAELVGDLGLDIVLDAMAAGDKFLREIAHTALLCSLDDVDAIHFRQNVLRDCLANPAVVRDIYDIAVAAIEGERKHYWGLMSRHPGGVLHRSLEVLQMFVALLRRLRNAAQTHADGFASEGFLTLFAMLREELAEDYLQLVEAHIERLKFRRGVLVSAVLGVGNKGADYALRKPNRDDRPWVRRMLTRQPAYTFHIHERDEAGARALAGLRDRGVNLAANAAAQAADHIVSFFRMLRAELAFYVGCLNLDERLRARGAATCFPDPAPCRQRRQTARHLYDVSLALLSEQQIVGNDIDGDDADLFIVTGANQGGKSTWLRAVGAAQLMMQCGMFVAAHAYGANLCSGLFVHYRREEDIGLRAGKFEEELQRISAVVDHLAADGIVLFNESLQSTNEREGSEIGRQIVAALLDSRVKVFFVTHLYDLAETLHEKRRASWRFLRAERRDDGSRSFLIVPGRPSPTSHAKDVYEEVFGDGRRPSGAADEAADDGARSGLVDPVSAAR
jgi:DNA mismatch repair ATPase MutS